MRLQRSRIQSYNMSSILSTVPLYVLANSLALNRLLDEAGRSVDWKLWAYAAFTQRDGSRPDHVFMQRWQRFEKQGGYENKTKNVGLLQAIKLVAEEYLEISNGRLYVKNQADEAEPELPACQNEQYPEYQKSAHFDRWQNIRARMTTWPIKLYMLYRYYRPLGYFLAHPQEPMVADFIRSEGLNETHLHLNGCLYPESEWLKDLYAVPEFLRDALRNWHKPGFCEHYANTNPRLTPHLAANRLKLARGLRDAVLLFADWFDRGCPDGEMDTETVEGTKTTWHENLIRETFQLIRRYSLNPHFFAPPPLAAAVPMNMQKREKQEMLMWMRSFRILEKESKFPYKRQLQMFLHLYLLLENEHVWLNCHTERRNGFAAFGVSNDHTHLAVGDENYYKATFYHLLKSAEAKEHNYIEVRVTPQSLRKNYKLFLKSYQHACRKWEREQKEQLRMQSNLPPQSMRRPQLVLVAHMIKKEPDNRFPQNKLLLPPLFDSERKTHMKEAVELARVARYLMARHRIPIALDAANSELNQAPEVFAPAYRLFERESGVSHKTYHCGEDFLHLISGIRAVYEAISFLNLRNGNRIGHAISVGIPPKEWVESMSSVLLLSKREWLLNMIFVWKLMHEYNPAAAEKAEREAVRVAGQLFAMGKKTSNDRLSEAYTVKGGGTCFPYHSIHTLSDFFDMRQFEPTYVRKWLSGQLPLSAAQAEEWEFMDEKKKRFGTMPAEMYGYWNVDSECRKAQEELIEVKSNFLTESELLELQQRVQHLIAARDVVIETLPVSNLRISQYRHIQEHHILRWLKVKGYAQAGDADMNICMGSDDPGIFATNIKNEYYHLYMNLRNAGVPAYEAVEKLRRVNNAGRVYAFRKLPDMEPTPFRITSALNNSPRPQSLWERMERNRQHREQEGCDPYDFRPYADFPREKR